MSTQDYELLEQSPSELEQVIRQYPNTVKSLAEDVLWAMLGWAQAGQDITVYDPCSAELARRGADDYQSLTERMHEIRGHEAAIKGRITTALEFEHIIEGFDR